jgi:hypothetical protein
MKERKILMSAWVALALILISSSMAGAESVGRLTQVEGQVDLLKGGNLPATPVKVDDTVAPADIIRTKALSRAQITFIDNSILTISPESRIAIQEFKFEPARKKRHAVLEIFQGLALTVVNKIMKAEEPDFILKTQTALLGVRGTEIGIRTHPNSSTILNFKGLTQVGNIFPEVSQLSLKAFKVAFTFGPWKDGSNRWVLLKDMQGTMVARNLPPTKPFALTRQDQELFMRQLVTYAPSQSRSQHTPARTMTQDRRSSAIPVSLENSGAQKTLSILTTVTVPPTLVPKAQVPPPPPPPTQSGGTCTGGSSMNED